MIINNVAYNHFHEINFSVDKPSGINEYMLILFKSPAILTINEKEIDVTENTIIIYNINSPHHFRQVEGIKFTYDWIKFLFENEELDFFETLNISFDTPILCNNSIEISFLIKCISSEKYSSNFYSAESINCYSRLLFYKISEGMIENIKSTQNTSHELMSTIKNDIYNKPYEHKTVEQAASFVNMSVSGFQHLYKKTFGISFVNDIINSRIEYAKWHLVQTEMSIRAISEACGYNNQTHFFRQFKTITNTTPKEYRKLYKK